ncbi:MAG: hypothetical protein C5B50_17880 [Verrucomicrobia bacterium]|nr:MAG: hypothetical protein C5B50_17880 [Verrucomicrobiota bacterium]
MAVQASKISTTILRSTSQQRQFHDDLIVGDEVTSPSIFKRLLICSTPDVVYSIEPVLPSQRAIRQYLARA